MKKRTPLSAGYRKLAEEKVAYGEIYIRTMYESIKVNTKITKKGKIKFTNLDNFLLYRIVKVFHFI